VVATAAAPGSHELHDDDRQRRQTDEDQDEEEQVILIHGRFPSAASATIFAIRSARVCGRRAVAICVSPSFLTDGGKPSQFARAVGTASNAAANSAGSIPASGPSSIVHVPFAFATSMARMPAGASSPSFSSAAMRAL